MNIDTYSDSNNEAAGTQIAHSGGSSGDVHDAAQQADASLARFLQEDQRIDEDLSRLMDGPNDQIWRLEKEIEEVRRATERNLELIRSYRR